MTCPAPDPWEFARKPLAPDVIHAVLDTAFETVAGLRGRVDLVSTDTAFAIGESLGALSKAKGLVGRDVDDARGRT